MALAFPLTFLSVCFLVQASNFPSTETYLLHGTLSNVPIVLAARPKRGVEAEGVAVCNSEKDKERNGRMAVVDKPRYGPPRES